jgi:hypothetical protein
VRDIAAGKRKQGPAGRNVARDDGFDVRHCEDE